MNSGHARVSLGTAIVGTIPAALAIIAIGRQAGFDWGFSVIAAYVIVAWCASAGYLYGRGQQSN